MERLLLIRIRRGCNLSLIWLNNSDDERLMLVDVIDFLIFLYQGEYQQGIYFAIFFENWAMWLYLRPFLPEGRLIFCG